jgi:hypothetical protein
MASNSLTLSNEILSIKKTLEFNTFNANYLPIHTLPKKAKIQFKSSANIIFFYRSCLLQRANREMPQDQLARRHCLYYGNILIMGLNEIGNCSQVRAALGVEDNFDKGYISNKAVEMQKELAVINAAINNCMFVLSDVAKLQLTY